MSHTTLESCHPGTVLPEISELFVDSRDGVYLLINPRGPKWCAGSVHFALVAELLDGRRSLHDIHRVLAPALPGLSISDVLSVADALVSEGMFLEGEKLRFRALSSVMFNIVKSCNLNCPFCYYESGPHIKLAREKILSVDQWLSVAAEIVRLNPDSTIYVSGGEPLVRPDCIDLLVGLGDAGVRTITLMTNGTLFKPDHYERLAGVDGLRVQVSIDSIVPDENAATRGVGSLEKALSAIDALAAAGVDVFVTSTLTQINRESVLQLKNACNERGVYLKFTPFFLAGDRSKQNAGDLALSPDEVLEAFQCKDIDPVASRKEDAMSAFLREVDGSPKYGCGVGHATLTINPDGSISPCNHLADEEFLIGNVTRESMQDVVDRGRARYAKIDVDRMPKTGCGGCEIRYICGGGCKASSYHAFGKFDTPPPDCSFLKKMHLDALWRSVKPVRIDQAAS